MHLRIALTILLTLVTGSFVAAQASKPKLNVIFITVDDLNTSLGCYGHPQVKTPNIDRLAARGVQFDKAYCQYPVCNPSRTSFLTGLRPETTQVLDNKTNFRSKVPDAVTLPELYRKNGYFTARIGKISHDGYDDPKIWDTTITPVVTAKGEQGDGAFLREEAAKWCRWRAADGDDEDQPDGQTVRESIRLMKEHRDKPFFLGVGLRRPHDPWVAPKQFFEMYPLETIQAPTEPADRTELSKLAAAPHNMRGLVPPEKVRDFIRAYYACISFMDAQVGKLLDAIDETDLADRTIIIFVSDHGWHEGDHGGMWLKATLFEQATRVPLIVSAPSKSRSAVSPRLVELVDLYPTLTELCALTPPPTLEGTSFVPLLDQRDRPWKKAAFTVVSRQGSMGRSVRTERYRYTEWPDGERELYDHKSDADEYRNLITEYQNNETLAELRNLLQTGWKNALPPP